MDKEIKSQLEDISIELSALTDTFKALELACNNKGTALPPQSLFLPTKKLIEITDKLRDVVEPKRS